MTYRNPPLLAEGLEKSYGKTAALQGLNLIAQEGTGLALVPLDTCRLYASGGVAL